MGPVTALRQALAASRVVSRIAGGSFVDYSPDGTRLATGFGVDAAIWDARTGLQIVVLPSEVGRLPFSGEFSPDGSQLAVAYESIGESGQLAGPLAVLWDTATGDIVGTFAGPGTTQPRLSFSPNGSMLAVTAAGEVVVWDVVSGTERYRIDYGEGREAYSPSFSPDGTLLAVSDLPTGPDEVSRVVLHDAVTGAEIDALEGAGSTSFDPTGRHLAAVSQQRGTLVIWQVASREVVASVDVSGTGAVVGEWSPDGRIIAVSGNEGIPRLFDVETGEEALALVGHDSIVWSLSFNPDGRHLAGAGSDADTLVWDVTASGSREVATFATPYSALAVADGVKYDEDGDTILVASDEGSSSSVARLDATTGEVRVAIPDQLSSWPHAPSLAPEAAVVASLNADLTAALHDAETFAATVPLPERRYALDVSNDGSRAVLGSVDPVEGVVVEVGSWDELVRLDEPISFADLSPDGTLVAAYNGGTGHGWLIDVETGSTLATFLFGLGLPDAPEWFPAHFSPDGSVLAVLSLTGRVGMLDVAALRDGASLEEALVHADQGGR
jgi:WD40 repeat protein